MTVDADMTILNASSHHIQVEVQENTAMDETFPSQMVMPWQTAKGYISTSKWKPYQASFEIEFDNENKMKIELGDGAYNTDATPDRFKDGRVGVVLAPGNPLKEVDYTFQFVVCDGSAPLDITKVLRAKAQLLLKTINDEGLTLDVGGASVNLSDLILDENAISCTSGVIHEASPEASDVPRVVATISIDKAEAKGSITYNSTSGPFSVSITGLSVIVGLDTDPHSATPIVTVKSFQLSLTDCELSGSILSILEGLDPEISRALPSAKQLAGVFNTSINDRIISGLTDIINGILLKFGA